MKPHTAFAFVAGPMIIVGVLVSLIFTLKINDQNESQATRLARQNITIKELTTSVAHLVKDDDALVNNATRRQPVLNYLKCQYARSRFTALLKSQSDDAYQHLAGVLLSVPKGTPPTDPRIVAAGAAWSMKTDTYDRALVVPDICVAPPSNP